MRFRVVSALLVSVIVGYLTLFLVNSPWQVSALSVGVVAGLLSTRLGVAAFSSLIGSLPFIGVLALRTSDPAGGKLLGLIAMIAGLPPFAILGLLTLSYLGISISTASIVSTVLGTISSRKGRAG
ncbi:MAG: hypothetical protein ACO2O1_05890 [Candidatus Caldarchaeales archaeon]|jgi:hypothetical protein